MVFWEMKTGKKLATCYGFSDWNRDTWAVVAPDGSYDSSDDGNCRHFRLLVRAVLGDGEVCAVLDLCSAGAHGRPVGIPARHKAAAAGGAYRVLAEGITERYPIPLDQAIQYGRSRRRITGVSEHVSAPLIGVEQDDIGALIRARLCAHEVDYSLPEQSAQPDQCRKAASPPAARRAYSGRVANGLPIAHIIRSYRLRCGCRL